MAKRLTIFFAAGALVASMAVNSWAVDILSESWTGATVGPLANGVDITADHTWTYTVVGTRSGDEIFDNASDLVLISLANGGSNADVAYFNALGLSPAADQESVNVTISFDFQWNNTDASARRSTAVMLLTNAVNSAVSVTSGYVVSVNGETDAIHVLSAGVLVTDNLAVFGGDGPTFAGQLEVDADAGQSRRNNVGYTATCTFSKNGADTDVSYSITRAGGTDLIASASGTITGVALPSGPTMDTGAIFWSRRARIGMNNTVISTNGIPTPTPTRTPGPNKAKDWRQYSYLRGHSLDSLLSMLHLEKLPFAKQVSSAR